MSEHTIWMQPCRYRETSIHLSLILSLYTIRCVVARYLRDSFWEHISSIFYYLRFSSTYQVVSENHGLRSLCPSHIPAKTEPNHSASKQSFNTTVNRSHIWFRWRILTSFTNIPKGSISRTPHWKVLWLKSPLFSLMNLCLISELRSHSLRWKKHLDL